MSPCNCGKRQKKVPPTQQTRVVPISSGWANNRGAAMSPTPERKRPAQPVKTSAWARAQQQTKEPRKPKKADEEPGIVDRVIDKVTKKKGGK